MLTAHVSLFRLIACAWTVASVGVAAFSARADNACDQTDVKATEFGLFASNSQPLLATGNEVVIQAAPAGQDVRYVRLLLTVADLNARGWVLSLRNQNRTLLESFGADQFTAGATRWTRRLDAPRGVLYATVEVEKNGSDPKLVVAKTQYMPKEAKHPYYSFSGAEPSWTPLVAASPDKRIVGDSVGLLLGNFDRQSWCCSGVVIAENVLLTNWHCGGASQNQKMWTKDVCRNTIVNLAWDAYPDSAVAGTVRDREFVCTEVLDSNEPLDIAVLKIRSLNGNDTARPTRIRTTALQAAETVNFIHHPACEPKQITTASCQINVIAYPNWRGLGSTDVLHSCDSEGGSSGGGIFDMSGDLVALHHLGYQRKDNGDCDYQNKAVAIVDILTYLRTKLPMIAAVLRTGPN